MANKLYNETDIRAIANAIREKNGGTQTYTVSEMAAAIRAIAGGGSEPLAEFSQMNPIVAQYMAEVAYSPDDYSASRVLPYTYAETDYDKGHPTGYDVNITQSGEVHLADDLSVVKSPSVVGVNTLYNAVPNDIAHWWNTVDGNVTQNGTIKPTGQVRMIKTTANNVRDLGGWACDGGTVKYGKLFRGGLLSESDRAVLVDQCHIRHDLDLRGKGDNEGLTASPLGSDIAYTCPDEYVWYSLKNEDDWKTIIGTVFRAASRNEPVIFHCAAGADRTGTVACIIEAILGVGQADIDKDFELTSFAIAPNARRRTDADWLGLIDEINAISVGETFRDKVINWVGYLGFTAEDINAFRAAMIDGTPASITLEEYVPMTYTNLADPTSDEWMDGYRLSSSGVEEPTAGVTLMNTIPCVRGDVIRVKGVTTVVVAQYKSGTFFKRSTINTSNTDFGSIVVDGDYNEFTIAYTDITSIRFYGTLSGTADDVIITVNEPIV